MDEEGSWVLFDTNAVCGGGNVSTYMYLNVKLPFKTAN